MAIVRPKIMYFINRHMKKVFLSCYKQIHVSVEKIVIMLSSQSHMKE